MVCRPRVSPVRVYCVRVSPIRSIAGSIASLTKASPAYGCEQDAGASRLFPPRYATAEAATQELRQTVNRTPWAYRQAGTRWTLGSLRTACPWLWLRTDSGLHQLLKRLRITWQRARSYIHSPDLDYDAKLANVQAVGMLAAEAPGQVIVVYLDEVTIAPLSLPGARLCAPGPRPVATARTPRPQQQYVDATGREPRARHWPGALSAGQ